MKAREQRMARYYAAIGREVQDGEKTAAQIAAALGLNKPYVCRIMNNMVDLRLVSITGHYRAGGGTNDSRIYGLPKQRPPSPVQALLQSPWGAHA